MSATSAGGATCPICEGFEGEPSSVEAHISASSGEHEGSYGREYREELEEQASGGSEMVSAAEYQEQSDVLEGSSESSESGGESEVEVSESGGSSEPATGSSAAVPVGAAGAAAVPFLDEIDTKVVIAGLVVTVLVAWLLLSDGSEPEPEPTTSEATAPEPEAERGGMI